MSAVEELQANRNTRYRHEESENYLARGVECMLLAEESGYRDRQLLTEACDSFMEAIKFNRQKTEAYVGMAYLLWILGDSPQALRYLEQGLRTQPNHPDVHALIKQITGKTSQVRPQTTLPHTQDEEQTLYQHAVELVQAVLTHLESEKTATIAASINHHAIERLQENLQDWEHRYDEVLKAIDALSAFHQRVLLTVELGPVQDRILDYHQALRHSERLLGLDDKIVENINSTKEYLGALSKGDPGMFRAYLELLLDNCDVLADQLEAFEKEGLNIRTLDSHYQTLSELVEELQIAVEGDH